MNEWAGISQRTKDLQAENAQLKEALREAIMCRSLVKRTIIDCDPAAGSTYAVDWTDDVKHWAALCDLDLDRFDPSFYCK